MTRALEDARRIADVALAGLDLPNLLRHSLRGIASGPVDIVAVGKAAVECADTARDVLGSEGRALAVTEASAPSSRRRVEVVIGDHPVPGAGSLAAGARLESFLAEGHGTLTLWIVSGGASSLCARPLEPVTLADLRDMWRAALAAALNITELNHLRAAASALCGGLVLRRVRTERSLSLVMVDNVVSGAPWVASGLTYDHALTTSEVDDLLQRLEFSDPEVAHRLRAAARRHVELQAEPVTTTHENRVLADPRLLLERAEREARRLGYDVRSLGASISEPADVLATRMASALSEPGLCVVGVGEVAVAVTGAGRGGRCQQVAVLLAPHLAIHGDAAGGGVASDGRDHEDGVAGALVDSLTWDHARAQGVDLAGAADRRDSRGALGRVGALINGQHTGWNLCDLYLACRPR